MVCGLLQLSGVPWLVRETVQRRTVTILCYHQLTPSVADVHFRTLRKHYTPIRLQEYLDARRTGTMDRLPPKSVVVTIDDGHKSIYQLKDVFVRHRMPVTVFVCSGFVEAARRFWFLAPGLSDTRRQQLKAASDTVRIETLRAMGFDQSVEFGDRDGLTLCEILELRPWVDFEAHSITHPILSQCSDAKSEDEITTCRMDLERWLGAPVRSFAYPNGSYSTRELEYVRRAGYECAVTTQPGFNTLTTPSFELRRFVMRDDCGPFELLTRACGVWNVLPHRSSLKARQ